MTAPADARFLDSHEWHITNGNIVTIGISKFAVDELTDVTYVDLPDVDDEFGAGESIGEIESVKATSDIYTAVAGKVVEVNEALSDDPGAINEDPFGAGWLVKIEAEDLGPLEALMDSETYEKSHG